MYVQLLKDFMLFPVLADPFTLMQVEFDIPLQARHPYHLKSITSSKDVRLAVSKHHCHSGPKFLVRRELRNQWTGDMGRSPPHIPLRHSVGTSTRMHNLVINLFFQSRQTRPSVCTKLLRIKELNGLSIVQGPEALCLWSFFLSSSSLSSSSSNYTLTFD